MTTQIAPAAIVYQPHEDGDMIRFGPNCSLSINKVRGMVSESGPIVKRAFEKWLDDMKAQVCADAFKPLAEAAQKPVPIGDGGPAFPHKVEDLGHGTEGMRLRDYFAAKAAASLLAGAIDLLRGEPSAYAHGHCNSVIADRAYALADEMLKRRQQF